jgi:hypothetical protein
MKFLNFFQFLWVVFCPPRSGSGPDSESGSTDLIESGSNLDPDPKHWAAPSTYYVRTESVAVPYVLPDAYLDADPHQMDPQHLNHAMDNKKNSFYYFYLGPSG